ncbi:MAG TPA: RHS repeat-associated core domain-containing protein, partial [Caulobacteraceae bacterium]
ARAYDPTLGRFLSADPAGYASDVNSYAYVGNDPVNGTDPSGMMYERPAWMLQDDGGRGWIGGYPDLTDPAAGGLAGGGGSELCTTKLFSVSVSGANDGEGPFDSSASRTTCGGFGGGGGKAGQIAGKPRNVAPQSNRIGCAPSERHDSWAIRPKS